MTDIDDAPNVLLAELKWVHDLLRHDLETCRRLAADVSGDASATEVRTRIAEMQTTGGLSLLRLNCLRHCRFVHAHHNHEDVMLFPAARNADPLLAAVVDKLEADHRKISGLLDDLDSMARDFGTDDESAPREQLVRLLDELSRDLLEHLSFEEESLAPVLQGLGRWPAFSLEHNPEPRWRQKT